MKGFTALLLLLSWQLLLADDPPVYESLHSVHIGPVFLTPEQRHWLDERRKWARQQGADDKLPEKEGRQDTKRPARAAGYIISSRGSKQRWQGSDFRQASSSTIAKFRFPDDIKITRHRVPEIPTQKNKADDDHEAGK